MLALLARPLRSLSSARTLGSDARLLLMATLANGLVLSSWSLFFNFFILERGWNKEFLGIANSIPSVAGLLVTLPLGLFIDRIGRKRGMLFGLLIYTLSLAVQLLVDSPLIVLGMAFLSGIGTMLYVLCQAPYMMDISTGNNRAMLFSLNFALSVFAGAVGNLVAGQLPGIFETYFTIPPRTVGSYQAVLLVSVFMSSLALIPTFLLHETTRSDFSKPNNQIRELKRVMFNPLVLKLAIPNVVICLGIPLIIPYQNIFFSERHFLSDQSLGALFSLYSLLIGLGSMLSPAIADLLHSKIRTVVLTEGCSVLFLLLFGLTPLTWLAAASYLARGVLMNMSSPLYTAFALEQVEPQDHALANSVLNLSWQIGWAFCPSIGGLVLQRSGFTPLFLAGSLFIGIGVLLIWVFFKNHAEMPALQLALKGQD